MATNLLASVESSSSDTSDGTWNDIANMASGTVTVVGTGSVIRLKLLMSPVSNAANQSCNLRFAHDGSAISGGPVVSLYNDNVDKASGIGFTHHITGLSAGTHTFSAQWITDETAISVGTWIRRFEVMEFTSGVTIKIDVATTSAYTFASGFEDITNLTGTFTTAASAGHMMVANVTLQKESGDTTAQLRFAVEGTAGGPYGAIWNDGAAGTDQAGTGMEWFKSGLSAAETGFSLQGKLTRGAPDLGADNNSTFQVVEFASSVFSLETDVLSTASDTSPGGAMAGMTGTVTPDNSNSVMLILAGGLLDLPASDNAAYMVIADDDAAVGGRVYQFGDTTNSSPGFNVSYAVTSETAETVWTLEWESVTGSPVTGTLERAFQVIDFENVAAGGNPKGVFGLPVGGPMKRVVF